MKPEISAPGGYILSTWPVSQGSWAVYSGTSMATPYVGILVLYVGFVTDLSSRLRVLERSSLDLAVDVLRWALEERRLPMSE